jgi:hypothetical protein
MYDILIKSLTLNSKDVMPNIDQMTEIEYMYQSIDELY